MIADHFNAKEEEVDEWIKRAKETSSIEGNSTSSPPLLGLLFNIHEILSSVNILYATQDTTHGGIKLSYPFVPPLLVLSEEFVGCEYNPGSSFLHPTSRSEDVNKDLCHKYSRRG